MQIDYGRLNALENALGGRAAIEAAFEQGRPMVSRRYYKDIAFDTPGLTDGVVIYTPKVDDLLLDVWLDLGEAWDSDAFADIGTFVGSATGLLAWMGTPATFFRLGGAGYAQAAELAGAGLVSPSNALVLSTAQAISDDTIWNAPGGASPAGLVWQDGNYPWALVPARFTDVHPLKMVVSQDGSSGGADPGGVHGKARVYVEIGAASPSPG